MIKGKLPKKEKVAQKEENDEIPYDFHDKLIFFDLSLVENHLQVDIQIFWRSITRFDIHLLDPDSARG